MNVRIDEADAGRSTSGRQMRPNADWSASVRWLGTDQSDRTTASGGSRLAINATRRCRSCSGGVRSIGSACQSQSAARPAGRAQATRSARDGSADASETSTPMNSIAIGSIDGTSRLKSLERPAASGHVPRSTASATNGATTRNTRGRGPRHNTTARPASAAATPGGDRRRPAMAIAGDASRASVTAVPASSAIDRAVGVDHIAERRAARASTNRASRRRQNENGPRRA